MGDFSTSHDGGRLVPKRGCLPSFPHLACKRSLAVGLALLMAACTPPQPPVTTQTAAARSPQPARGTLTGTPAAAPTALNAAEPEGRAANPLVAPGTGVFVAAPATRAAHVDVSPEGDVSFNFVNADVREVVREILGNQLHLNYVVDSKVQAMITAQTGGPVPKQAVLPTLESVLRANGLALVQVNG